MIKNRKINLIVIHCSATRVTQDFTVGELEACHLARGFRDIGYHYSTFISTSSLLLSSNINFCTHLFPPQSYVSA